MENTTLYIWSETIPNWLMAFTALAAAVVFAWRRQDRKEAQAAREANIKDSVNAVWVTARIGSDEQPKWGILVTNNLQAPITQLQVTCSGNSGSNTLMHANVQPGRHFFESLPNGSSRPWRLPTANIASFEFITASKKHTTQRMSFWHSGRSYMKELGQHS